MIRYAVVKFKHEEMLLNYDDHGGGDKPVWMLPQDAASTDGLSVERAVYFVDSLKSAQNLALELTQRFPHYGYMVVEAKFFYQRPPGEAAVSQYTDKGLMPV